MVPTNVCGFLLKFRLLLVSFIAACCIMLPTFYVLSSSFESLADHQATWATGSIRKDSSILNGRVIMGSMLNETKK